MIPASRSAIEDASRAAAKSVYVGDNTALCVILGGHPIYVDTRDTSVSPWLILTGYWESWISAEMAGILNTGDRCVDIGANAGYYSVLMSDVVGPTGAVVAVEANPRLANLVSRSLSMNAGCPWTVVQKAIHNCDGKEVDLSIPSDFLGGASIQTTFDGDRVTVPTTTIDSLLADFGRVDLIKMDIEGAEELAWDGAQKTIAANPDIKFITEFVSSRYKDPAGFLKKIRGAGFTVESIEPESTSVVANDSDILNDKEYNLLLTR